MSDKNYISESFKQRADSSAFFEAWVGAKLSRSNLYTLHHPFTLASETGNPLGFYAHTWDLCVGETSGELLTRVEVKSVNLTFTDPTDYPHMGLLVCSDASWQKKWPGATTVQRDFLMVSRETGAIVWLPIGAGVTRREVRDPSRNETFMCVVAEKGELSTLSHFVNYVKDLHGL